MHIVCRASKDRLYNGHSLACSDLKTEKRSHQVRNIMEQKAAYTQTCIKTRVSTIIQKTNILTDSPL